VLLHQRLNTFPNGNCNPKLVAGSVLPESIRALELLYFMFWTVSTLKPDTFYLNPLTLFALSYSGLDISFRCMGIVRSASHLDLWSSDREWHIPARLSLIIGRKPVLPLLPVAFRQWLLLSQPPGV